eukprot:TRINITY_DN23540_c0_g1_i3.p2 TRINITY_DN23540_c0_g1~~TRINITY_DN23540_c0_g1_i3.p2  ORF type:complete len:188 (+),score=50.84 TRINITY_DN23540_c0_g1_i3:243-806(+)
MQASPLAASSCPAACGGSGATISTSTLDSLASETLEATAIENFKQVFEKELEVKRFFNEDDRVIVRGIVMGYLEQRLLVDGLARQDVAAVRRSLRQLEQEGLLQSLQHPVDDSLDTLLHKAVRLPSSGIVQALLDAGADPLALNLIGDTPSQLFALPRLGASAQLARSRQRSQSTAQQQYAVLAASA